MAPLIAKPFIAKALSFKLPELAETDVCIPDVEELTLSAAPEAPDSTVLKHSVALVLTSLKTLDASSNAVILNSMLLLKDSQASE
jgi:hypothetical protein